MHLNTTPNMLALVVVLRAGFQCKDDLYNYADRNCMTADICHLMDSDYHAYKIL